MSLIFADYNSEFHSCRRKGIIDQKTSWQDFYHTTTRVLPQTDFDPFAPVKLRLEENWFNNKRPYYNIYPSIIPSLTKISLESLTVDYINLPLPELLLRFPNADHPLRFWHDKKEYAVKTIMVADKFRFDNKPNEDFLIFWIDIGEVVLDWNVQLFRLLCKKPGTTVTDAFNLLATHPSKDEGVKYPDDFIENCAKLVCTLCLMANDEFVVQPEVLSSDEEKYEKTKDPKYVTKAINRGKYGWNVGKNIEIVPHVRSACPAALYWTGVGKKIPKIRFRRGCIVHRKKLNDIPTGYFDLEDNH
jgi:hypothetical protein